MQSKRSAKSVPAGLAKSPTGIRGLDEVLGGGLPRGRPTLVCGSAGCGKTLFGIEFLARGALEFGEPGVLLTFEESSEELARNVQSLGFDLADLERRGLLAVDHVVLERAQIEETGDYDLEGLFIRLGAAIDSVGAKRVVLDTIETLFGGLSNAAVLRSELRRLFQWLKERGVTAIITGERGGGELTRQGLEEYVSDCVILLDHRVEGQRSTRRLRVVKYRGSFHGTNEYPFLIGRDGIAVLPVTSLALDHRVSSERIPTGIAALDAMLGGDGYYRGSSVMVTGTAGTGKTTVACHLASAACRRGERCLYFAFEESAAQIVRNMASIGIDLGAWADRGLLRIHASRPTLHGLEAHLVEIHRLVKEFRPHVVVVDPITNFSSAGAPGEVDAMLLRLIDFLKSEGVTAFFTSLTGGGDALERTDVHVSSLVDTWLLLRDIEAGGERNRGLYVLKSRGMRHSNQIREFVVTDHGVELLPVYTGPEGVLTGSLRAATEARERADDARRADDASRRRRDAERRRRLLEAQIAALRHDLESAEEETAIVDRETALREAELASGRADMARRRGGASPARAKPSNGRKNPR